MEIWIMRYRVKKTEAPAKHPPPPKKNPQVPHIPDIYFPQPADSSLYKWLHCYMYWYCTSSTILMCCSDVSIVYIGCVLDYSLG